MTDPFLPLDDFKAPETYKDLVYPDSRYEHNIFQGISILLPSKAMMFKLMCACIGIT